MFKLLSTCGGGNHFIYISYNYIMFFVFKFKTHNLSLLIIIVLFAEIIML